ncbi:glycosyltransferase [Chitinispirillales bacterium ANBcel5]|uniref:glycosyltransferase n=1 Tax=Cellulosispirillum alkaliphilum TaxID=3039283 RepID=UPI002A50124D|nr:glycosyltransferase [Chitinispirillales bacterium ANBcel5]
MPDLTILITLLTILLLLYTLFIALFTILNWIYHCRAHNPNKSTASLSPVSVIIPFRDEAAKLPSLVSSLSKQKYNDKIEYIFIDDNSTDEGSSILKKLCARYNLSARIIPLTIDPTLKLTSKQQALDLGVLESQTDLIVFTDADMVFDPLWVSSLVSSMAHECDFVFGHTSIIEKKKSTLLTRLESFQLETLFCFAHAFSAAHITGSCMGNNIIFKKENYLRIGGQKSIGYSIIEDRQLLYHFRKNGYKTRAQVPFSPKAFTYPSPSLRSFSNQARRWARGGLGGGGSLLFFALLFFAQNVTFLAIIPDTLPLSVKVVAMLNFLLTWLFVASGFKAFKAKEMVALFPLYYIFLIVETIIFGLLLVSGSKIEWKSRRVS